MANDRPGEYDDSWTTDIYGYVFGCKKNFGMEREKDIIQNKSDSHYLIL